MVARPRYLFDSDVLISAARLHYAPAHCQIFWDWLSAGHQAGLFFSIDKVRDELQVGKDDVLKAWAEQNAAFFKPSLTSLPMWGKLTRMAADPQRGFKVGAIKKFNDEKLADAWLIALAAQAGFVLISNEVSAPLSKAAIKLPDAAEWLEVKTAKLFDIFKLHAGHNFSFIITK